MLRPAVAAAMRPSTNGVTAAPEMPAASASASAPASTASSSSGSSSSARGSARPAARRSPAGCGWRGRGDLGRRFDAVRHRQTRRPRVERREPVVAPPEHGHACGLEVLERARQVEEGLGTGAHGDHRVVGDGVEIGRHVAGGLDAAVHAADAAGGEHADPRRRRRGPATPDTVVAPNGQRWARATGRSRSAALRAGPRIRSCSSGSMPDPGHAVEHGGHRRHRSPVADRREAAIERLAVRRRRQTEVGEDRRLQGHDGLTSGQCGGDLGRALRFDHVATPSSTKRVTASTWVVCGKVSITVERSWR